jgi:hypothetical protein
VNEDWYDRYACYECDKTYEYHSKKALVDHFNDLLVAMQEDEDKPRRKDPLSRDSVYTTGYRDGTTDAPCTPATTGWQRYYADDYEMGWNDGQGDRNSSEDVL